MAIHRCPGQESRFWKPQDIFETECVYCGAPLEFFKDDIKRDCPKCGKCCANPKLNLGCLAWCDKAEQCQELLKNK